jgi:hypothetical protein
MDENGKSEMRQVWRVGQTLPGCFYEPWAAALATKALSDNAATDAS